MSAIKLGRAFGIGIFVHWTFFLLPAFVLFQEGNAANVLPTLLFLGFVFACVVLHELGHALTARQFGIGTRDITLYPIGGVARLTRISEKPLEEFCIALAGPAVNVVIVGLLFVPWFLSGGAEKLFSDQSLGLQPTDWLLQLIAINFMLAVFNLLPAFPMDGGRVLRALLVYPFGRLRATQIAAGLGAAFAVLFALVAILQSQPFLFLLAIFVYLAGRQELAVVRHQSALQGQGPVVVDAPVQAGMEGFTHPQAFGFNGFVWDTSRQMWVLWQNGRPVRAFGLRR